jgi:hypothetical protein
VDDHRLLELTDHKFFMYDEGIYSYGVQMNPNMLEKRNMLEKGRRYLIFTIIA